MEQIVLKRSIGNKRGRQHASREDVLRMAKEREQEEYDTCGIGKEIEFISFSKHSNMQNFLCVSEIPDILDATQCRMLREWNQELRYLTNFKFRRFGKKHLEEALQKARKEPKQSKNIETKVLEKSENLSEEDKAENTESSLSNPVDATEDNPPTKCAMEVE